MDIINSILNPFFKILFYPFANMSPVWGMLVISFLAGITMLFIFKATSDQAGIKKAKNLFKAHFLAIRLYRDDLSLMMETMKNIVLGNFGYMKKSLRPMLFLIVPVAIIIIQLGTRYEYRPLRVGETTVVSLILDKHESGSLNDVVLELPDGLSLDIPPVRIDQLREINWRIKIERSGVFDIVFRSDNKTVKKRLQVVDSLSPLASRIARDDFQTALLNPGESSLQNSSFASMVSISYPKREFQFLGISIHWLVAFFVFSLIAAFACKGFLGVEV